MVERLTITEEEVDGIFVDSLKLRPKTVFGKHFANRIQIAFDVVSTAPTEYVVEAIGEERDHIRQVLEAVDHLYVTIFNQDNEEGQA